MKRHIFIFSCWSIFVTFGVIPFFMAHDWVIVWVCLRSFRKLFRYFNRMYLDMGFRNEVYSIEWINITLLTISFPLEYLVSVLIVLVTYPVARQSKDTKLVITQNFRLDGSLLYLMLLFISVPYFLSTLVYVCRKRTQVLESKKMIQRRRRAAKRAHTEHWSDSD